MWKRSRRRTRREAAMSGRRTTTRLGPTMAENPGESELADSCEGKEQLMARQVGPACHEPEPAPGPFEAVWEMRRGVRGLHQGPGTEVPSPQAGYKCATEPACPNSSPLANAGRTIQARASSPRGRWGAFGPSRAGSPRSRETASRIRSFVRIQVHVWLRTEGDCFSHLRHCARPSSRDSSSRPIVQC